MKVGPSHIRRASALVIEWQQALDRAHAYASRYRDKLVAQGKLQELIRKADREFVQRMRELGFEDVDPYA